MKPSRSGPDTPSRQATASGEPTLCAEWRGDENSRGRECGEASNPRQSIHRAYLETFNYDPRKTGNRPSRQMLVKGEIFTITVMALRPCGPASKSARKYFNADEK